MLPESDSLPVDPLHTAEFQSGPLLLEYKPEPKPKTHRRQVYALAICAALLLMSVGAERIHSYIISQEAVYSASRPGVRVSPGIRNEIIPITAATPAAPSASVSSAGTPPVTGTSKPAAVSPGPAPVTAWAYLVGNVDTGQIYISKNITEVLPIASISKLTATLVARQFMNQASIVPITQQALDVYSDAYGLELGEQFPVSEIYYPILLQSNDNAVEALAFAYGDPAGDPASTTASSAASSTDTAFVEKMNEYAAELNMTHSHFIDASGLSDGNVSSAADLFTLAKFLYADKFNDKLFTPNILAITTEPSVFVATTSDHGSHDFVNINPFAGNPAFVGGKTGRTNAAGETMLSIFNYQVDIGGHEVTDPIAVIVLHSDFGTRQADTEDLLAQVESGIAAGKY